MASNLWLSYAFLAASVYATLSLLDKVILEQQVSDPFSTTAFNNAPKFVIFVIVGLATGNTGLASESSLLETAVPIVVGASIGTLNVYSRWIYYIGLEDIDISRIVPILNTDIVFVMAMGALLLGESLAVPVYLGVIIIFLGTVLISLDDPREGLQFVSRQSLFYGLLAAFSVALISVQMKFLTPVLAVYAILFWFGIGGLVSLAIHGGWKWARGTLGGEEYEKLSVLSAGGISLIVSGIVSAGGYFPLIWALETGPVSIVAAIVNLQVLLVFFGVVVLTKFTPEVLQEQMDKITFAQKLTASALMLTGIVIIQLAS